MYDCILYNTVIKIGNISIQIIVEKGDKILYYLIEEEAKFSDFMALMEMTTGLFQNWVMKEDKK